MSEAETKKSQFQTLKDDENTNTIVVCKDWLEGNCPYTNETCMLGLHKYDLDKMPLCPFVRNNEKCPMIDNYCIYKHYRSQECSLYKFGFCPNGPLCPYRHVKRPSTAPLPHKMLIQQFLNSTPSRLLTRQTNYYYYPKVVYPPPSTYNQYHPYQQQQNQYQYYPPQANIPQHCESNSNQDPRPHLYNHPQNQVHFPHHQPNQVQIQSYPMQPNFPQQYETNINQEPKTHLQHHQQNQMQNPLVQVNVNLQHQIPVQNHPPQYPQQRETNLKQESKPNTNR